MQRDNSDFILYLESVLDRLSIYMEVNYYKDELYHIIFNIMKSTDIAVDMNQYLYNKLVRFQEEIHYYILFLDLIDMTDNWDYDDNVDVLFKKIVRAFPKLLTLFSDRKLKKLIIERYYDLLFKKIWVDYLNDDYCLMYYYNHLDKYSNLKSSICNFLDYNGINLFLDKDIEEYSLRDIFNIIGNYFQLPLIEDKLVDNNVDLKYFSKKRSYQRILDFILERSYKFFSKEGLSNKKKIFCKRR